MASVLPYTSIFQHNHISGKLKIIPRMKIISFQNLNSFCYKCIQRNINKRSIMREGLIAIKRGKPRSEEVKQIRSNQRKRVYPNSNSSQSYEFFIYDFNNAEVVEQYFLIRLLILNWVREDAFERNRAVKWNNLSWQRFLLVIFLFANYFRENPLP